MDGMTNLIELKGIGEKTAAAFARMGVRNVDSLISMYLYYTQKMCIINMAFFLLHIG